VWRKCETEPTWFIENFWHVVDPELMVWTLFKLRDYQRDDMEWLIDACTKKRERKGVLKARQIGWTTGATAIAFHDVFFRPNHPWLIASQGEDEAKDTLTSKLKQPYDLLPLWMRQRGPSLTDQNSERMTFSNGSSILSIPSTPKAGRSKAVFGVLLDEFAFAEYAEGMLGALDPLCYGPLIVFSTANGMGNPFHNLWVTAQSPDSPWDVRFRPWNVVPGRDQVWYEREKRKYRGREWQFYQEYPSTPEEAFAKTGRTVLPVDLLRENHNWGLPTWRLDLDLLWRTAPTVGILHEGLAENDEADNELWMWERPTVERDERNRMIRKPSYVVSCDVAEGLEHGDRTSIAVYDANRWEVVATYLGWWPVEDLGELLEWLGYAYHTALIVVERNNHGILPLDYLRRAGYPRLYRMDAFAEQPRGDRTPRYGWATNRATKPKMVNDMVRAIRDDVVALHDTRFFQEAMTFVADGKGGYAAAQGSRDDHVLGFLIGWQGCLDVGKYPVIYHDDTVRRLTWGEVVSMSDIERPPSGLATAIGQRRRVKPPKSMIV
jgi:hypothetical protein